MSDYGRMSGRLVSSYREDDRRRADDRRRQADAGIDRPSKPAAKPAPRLGLAAFARLMPWFA